MADIKEMIQMKKRHFDVETDTGFFSSVFQIIEHDIDRETAKKNVHQLKEFNTGGWERLWNIEFPV